MHRKLPMHSLQVALLLVVVAAQAGCTGSASSKSASLSSEPCPKLTPPQVVATSTVALESDRVCMSMYGLPCNALIHLLGPANAKLRGETRACVNETVSVYVGGKWVPDNKYQDQKAGNWYGDHCVAVSL